MALAPRLNLLKFGGLFVYFGVKFSPYFCYFLLPIKMMYSLELSFSPLVRKIWSSLVNLFKFYSHNHFWTGPKSAKKLLFSANFSIFPNNSIEMSKNETEMIVKSRLLPESI